MGNAFLWKWGCRSFKADRNKLFAINKRQIDNHTLMLYMLYSYISVVCTYHCTGVFKNIFFFTPGSLQVGRVEDHRMMFTWHLYLLQSYIQAVLYICIADYMMSFTLYTLISECIFSILFCIHFLKFWQGEFVLQSQVLQLIIISLFLWPWCVTQGWHWKKKLGASHSQGLKCY